MQSTKRRPLTIKDVFGTRKVKRSSSSVAPELQESTESSMDSQELLRHCGESSLSSKLKNSHTTVATEMGSEILNHSIIVQETVPLDRLHTNDEQPDERKKSLILFYKGKPKPFGDAKPPLKPQKTRSFKMDGIPAFMNQQIEKNAQWDTERRRKQRQRESATARSELGKSMASLPMQIALIRKQRPKVRFLNLPRGHPLFWDHNKLSAADFPEEDRAFLANVLKNPMQKVGGHPISSRVQTILKKLYLKDWDTATIGRCAMALFHPDSNPLNVSPEVNNYFFKRFNNLKTTLEEGLEVSYMDTTYDRADELPELYIRLIRDFEEATRSYGANQKKHYC
jgi:hypothetical protein